MKNNRGSVLSILRAVLALVLVIGSCTFLQPCIHEDGNFGTCHYAGVLLTWVGVILLLQAVCAVVTTNRGVRAGLAVASILAGTLAFKVPGGLIPLCGMNTMRCNLIMKPASMLLTGIYVVQAVAEVIILREEFRK